MSGDIILDVYACGWRLRAGLPLPATIPWPALAPGRPDVAFVAGDLALALDDPVADVGSVQFAADGTALVRFEAGYFLVHRDRVICDLGVATDSPELAPIIFGNVLACLGWQHGRLPLHASAVAIDGRAVILLGRAGAGKSALAAALVRRGGSILADEVAMIASGRCLPCGGPLQLADDVLEALGGVDPALPQIRSFASLAKRPWHAGQPAEARPYPVAAVVSLTKGEAVAPLDLVPIDDADADDAILRHLFWADMLRGEAEYGLRSEARLLAATAEIVALALPRCLDRLDDAATAIATHAGRGVPPI